MTTERTFIDRERTTPGLATYAYDAGISGYQIRVTDFDHRSRNVYRVGSKAKAQGIVDYLNWMRAYGDYGLIGWLNQFRPRKSL